MGLFGFGQKSCSQRHRNREHKWDISAKQAVEIYGSALAVIKELAKDYRDLPVPGLTSGGYIDPRVHLLVMAVGEIEYRLTNMEVRKQ